MSHSRNHIKHLSALTLALMLVGLGAWAALWYRPRNRPTSLRPFHLATESFGKLPLYFIENRGQMDSRVAYYVQGSDKTIYFSAEGLTFALTERNGQAHHEAAPHQASFSLESAADAAQQRYALKLDFVGANPDVRPRGQEQAEAVFSYFKGPRDQWQAGLKTYSRIVYSELWPGIDLVYAGTINRMRLLSTTAMPGYPVAAYFDRISGPSNRALYVAINGRGILRISPIPPP